MDTKYILYTLIVIFGIIALFKIKEHYQIVNDKNNDDNNKNNKEITEPFKSSKKSKFTKEDFASLNSVQKVKNKFSKENFEDTENTLIENGKKLAKFVDGEFKIERSCKISKNGLNTNRLDIGICFDHDNDKLKERAKYVKNYFSADPKLVDFLEDKLTKMNTGEIAYALDNSIKGEKIYISDGRTGHIYGLEKMGSKYTPRVYNVELNVQDKARDILNKFYPNKKIIKEFPVAIINGIGYRKFIGSGVNKKLASYYFQTKKYKKVGDFDKFILSCADNLNCSKSIKNQLKEWVKEHSDKYLFWFAFSYHKGEPSVTIYYRDAI